MSDEILFSQSDFEALCERMRSAGRVAFDTEFVGDSSYRPLLCLLQFGLPDGECFAVDPLGLENLDAWWSVMADESIEVVSHGNQAEIRFCLLLGGVQPRNLVDVQLAEGLLSRSYPLNYGALVAREIEEKIRHKETRSDWKRRPLMKQQIAYALEDVRHLLPVWDRQQEQLERLGRTNWAADEFVRRVDDIVAEQSRESYERISGIHKLNRRELAVARELSRWRDSEAELRDRPLKRVLRDDLIIELARRQPKNTKELLATREMDRSDYRRIAGQFIGCIQRGQAVPEDELPVRPKKDDGDKSQDEQVIGRLLSLALANRCAELNISPSLVATAADMRRLVRRHVYGELEGEPPLLMTGWRAQVCGDLLTDVLDGRIAVRVADVASDHPLVFERVEESSPG
ncbi:MAG: HRDC domain-containing protein [Planctomycetaceae bacterium]|nr:HRDC domain-containing protein [Planctomycetaceae bacterium]